MEELNINIGRQIQENLCDDCKETLKTKIKKRHILAASTPWGLKKLFKRIEDNACPACQDVIMKARYEFDARRT